MGSPIYSRFLTLSKGQVMMIDHDRCDGTSQSPSFMDLFIFNVTNCSADWGYVCLAQDRPSLDVTHCTFSSNTAAEEGGAIKAKVKAEKQLPNTSCE